MTDFFGDIAPLRFDPDAEGLAFRHYDPDEMVMGKRMEDHLRFAVAYWHSFAWPGGDPFGGQTFDRPWFGDTMELRADEGGCRLRDVRVAGPAVLLLPRCRHSPRRRDVRREPPELRGDRGSLRGEDGDGEDPAALGHGQHVLPPPFHVGRVHQPGPGRVRVECGDRETLHGCDAPAWRSELRALGRARGVRDAAQHRSGAGTRPHGAVPVDGGRLQAQDRVRGPDPVGAETAGAVEASVRLRCRDRVRVSQALRAGERGAHEHRAGARDPGRAFVRARDRTCQRARESSGRST